MGLCLVGDWLNLTNFTLLLLPSRFLLDRLALLLLQNRSFLFSSLPAGLLFLRFLLTLLFELMFFPHLFQPFQEKFVFLFHLELLCPESLCYLLLDAPQSLPLPLFLELLLQLFLCLPSEQLSQQLLLDPLPQCLLTLGLL